jgi:hypothetical protein
LAIVFRGEKWECCDRIFPFIFIFHILANFGEMWRLFSEEKNGNIVTEYSLLFLFFTFWRNLAPKIKP